MTIRQIQCILEVQRTRSISKAAENLFMAQPNLSGTIASLEQELGTQIFERNNRGATPTPEGLLILRQAAKIFETYQEMTQIANQSQFVRLNVGGVAYQPVARAYTRLCIEYQHFQKVMFTYGTCRIAEAIRKLYLSEIDLAVQIATGFTGAESLEAVVTKAKARGLSVTSMAEIPLMIRVGKQNPLYGKPCVKAEELSAFPYAGYCGPTEYSVNAASIENFVVNPDRIIRTVDRGEKNYLVANSTAYTIGMQLPKAICEQYGFHQIPIGKYKAHLIAMTRAGEAPNAVARRYLDLLREELSEFHPANNL